MGQVERQQWIKQERRPVRGANYLVLGNHVVRRLVEEGGGEEGKG